MKKLTTSALRKLCLDFFVERGHKFVKSDSLAPTNDPSVLFTSAGMNQFKDHFLGKAKDFKRATSCQKCLRTGDLEQVGETPFHHTFFEMLGNFSFGDYFKKEAIAWAWEFVTKVLGIPERQLWVSVYEDDQEAYDIWKKEIGLSVDKIKKFGQKDNFWPANAILDGPNGPCGPCSEIYFEKANGDSVEVWNLVFTQFNRQDGGKLEPLPNKNIDTGMGLERMASVLQGVDSNFDIDIFVPIVEAAKKAVDSTDKKLLRTIADHTRAVAFSICDGILPSNDGRGYVVRKLIRRCSFMAQLKEPKPFLYKIVSSVADSMGDQYPELLERRDNIAQIIKAEEEKYIKNILEGGSEKLNEAIDFAKKSGKIEFPAEKVVDLWMTYGIPPEATVERIQKEGLTTSSALRVELIRIEKDKSRVSSKIAPNIFSKDEFILKSTRFVGYEKGACRANVLQIIKDGKETDRLEGDGAFWVVLDETPFYAESGGQIGDRGELVSGHNKVKVLDVQKQKEAIVHLVEASRGSTLKVGDSIEAIIDPLHREAVKRAHTATHVLQAVLRQVLGKHVQQAGSYVEPDRFRFDFTHFKEISAEESERIRELLNDYVMKNDPLKAQLMPKTEAQKTGAIALFGEKYDDTVRVVSIADYSKEFCGGTHTESTGSIGIILLTSESSVGSGLRRIEALTGREAFKKIEQDIQILGDCSGVLKTRPESLVASVEELLTKTKALEKENMQLKEKCLKGDVESILKNSRKIKDSIMVIHKFKDFDVSLLRRAIDLLKMKLSKNGIFFLVSVGETNANFVCGLTQDLTERGLSADVIVKKILSVAGGSGGGRKDFAQGGTKEITKVDEILKSFETFVKDDL
jgi:alanyl-tRNA synthetase